MEITDLRCEDIVSAAMVEAGVDQSLDDALVQRTDRWLRAHDPLPMAEQGRMAVAQTTLRLLVNRLRFQDAVARNPQILEEDVSDPIVIVGFPRSGTTALQRMMSADTAVQCLAFWRVLNPAPFPGEAKGAEPAGRIAFAQAIEEAMKLHSPALFAAHPSVTMDAEEDWLLHQADFSHVANICWGPFTDEYLAEMAALPRAQTYQFTADMLRFLQWQDGGARGRPWILKSPAHIGYIDEMLAVHPRATFVYPRRDFETVMASFCHTLEMSLSTLYQPDTLHIGRLSMQFWLGEMARFQASRDRLGSALNLIELPYRDMLRDPVRHVAAVHEAAGRQLSPDGARAVTAWVEQNPAGKHGTNSYTLERYGLSEYQVAEAFAPY